MTEPAFPPYADVLGDVLPAHPRSNRRVGSLAVAATAVAAVAVASAGVAAAVVLSGGGAQPEDVLPQGAIGFVKLDLDPSAQQKLNIYSISKRFPDAAKELKSEDSLRDDVLRLAFRDSDTDLDYDRDVKPWIGDRVGVAFLPPARGEEEPGFVVAVAYTDKAKAEEGLAKAKAEAGTDDPLEYALVEDYALLGDDAEVVRAAADAKEHLADDEAYTKGVDALDGDQVALAWADLSRVWDALPAEVREQAEQAQDLDPSGQVVIGVQAEKDAIEVVGRTVEVRTGIAGEDEVAASEGTGLAGDLPDEAILAVSFSGLGDALVKGYDDVLAGLEDLAPDLEAQADDLGLDLPDDLATVLGKETAVAVWGDQDEPQVLVRTRSDDPGAGREVLETVFEASGGAESGESLEEFVDELDDGLAAGTPDALAAKGGLGDRADFKKAVPDAGDAGFVLFVSLQRAFAVGELDDENLEPLDAVGVTARGGADGEFRIRVTFR